MKSRLPTEEELLLWRQVTQQDKRLAANHRQRTETKGRVIVNRALSTAYYSSATAHHPLPSLGSYTGIDRNTAERFRKGRLPIDATLDLHGMTRDKAHQAFTAFLTTQCARGSRCLLVITGKGLRTEEGRQGILRESLPRWLDESELSNMVLAFDMAKPQHGGSGAYYILLRRSR